MKYPKINQQNVHLLLPNKVARLAARLLKQGLASDMSSALKMVYQSPVYTKLECESTKYWWLGVNALYEELLQSYHISTVKTITNIHSK